MRKVPIVTPAVPEPVASLVYTNWGPRRSLHRFLSLGFPEANSLHVSSTSPTHTSNRRLQDRCVGSGERGRVGGAFRRREGAGGSEALTSPGSSLRHRVPRMPFRGLAPTGPPASERSPLLSACASRRMTSGPSSSGTTDRRCEDARHRPRDCFLYRKCRSSGRWRE